MSTRAHARLCVNLATPPPSIGGGVRASAAFLLGRIEVRERTRAVSAQPTFTQIPVHAASAHDDVATRGTRGEALTEAAQQRVHARGHLRVWCRPGEG